MSRSSSCNFKNGVSCKRLNCLRTGGVGDWGLRLVSQPLAVQHIQAVDAVHDLSYAPSMTSHSGEAHPPASSLICKALALSSRSSFSLRERARKAALKSGSLATAPPPCLQIKLRQLLGHRADVFPAHRRRATGRSHTQTRHMHPRCSFSFCLFMTASAWADTER